jgi:hypothetical protein
MTAQPQALTRTQVIELARRSGIEIVDDVVVSTNGRAPTTKASAIRAERVEWLVPGRFPRAQTIVVAGFPGVGKSTINYDLAAQVSRGGETVLILTAEDHLAAVVRPRLEAAGADLDRVVIITREITLPDDVSALEDLVREHGAALLIIDPLVAFIGDGVNTHRDHHVRRVLAPLADLAERTGAAVVVVVHTNKGSGTEPLMRISGSVGFTGAARSVLLCAKDPQDEHRRIFAVVKSNLAEFPPPLAYRLVGVELADGITTSKVEWLGDAPEIDVYELLAERDPDDRSAREDAIEFLLEAAVQTTAQPAAELLKASKAMGIGDKTLQRARRSLGIPAWKEGFPGVWMWGPRSVSEVDTRTGPVTPVQLSGSPPPAETSLPELDLDRLSDLGGCAECGGSFGHMTACSRGRA